MLNSDVFSEYILRAFVYDAALDPPVVIFVKEEQCFSWVLVVDGSINFGHRCWQTKAAERFRKTGFKILASKSPDLITYK